jgi:hypothetical protein
MVSFKSTQRATFHALSIIFMLLTASATVWAQHEGHDMSNMPGMSKPKAKPKARPRPRPAAATTKRRPQAKAKHADASDNPADKAEANDKEASGPAITPTPPESPVPAESPAPSPADVHKHMNMPSGTGAKPSASAPEKRDATGQTRVSPQTEASEPQPANTAAPPQHKHDMGNMGESAPADKGQPAASDNSMPGMDMSNMEGMPMAPDSLVVMSGEQMKISIGPGTLNTLQMGRMGSGSSWQPSTTPMYMYTKVAGRWIVFVHADAKVGLNSQGGPRGITKLESQNWIMPMAFRKVGHGTLQLRGMFSLEPFSLSGGGSPELFQTGETYKGEPLIDTQHPHDLFMELSGTYTLALGDKATWFMYLGFPGEPALGPTTFMHRWSASENPSAPLAHHLQDSTHISFGVFTSGFTYRGLKLEGSVFNGREPDENRYDFEFNPWNSRSARLSFAPNDNWSMQVSYGLLKNPEALETGDVRRATASISYNRPLKEGNWATSLIWGRNHASHSGEASSSNGYTAESTVNFLRKNYLYTRLELVDKTELLRDEDRASLGITGHHTSFRVGAYTFGAARDVWNTEHFTVALGADATLYSKPAALDAVYGDNPTSYHFFVRIRPSHMSTNRRYK